MRFAFGDCVADFDTRELFRAGRPVHVEPKALQLLELLIAARPRAVSKRDLQDALWPKTYVTERSLARLAADLRTALSERGKEKKCLRTVHRFGYAFFAEASPSQRGPAGAAVFKLILGKREITLNPGENLLGRDPLCVACIVVENVSRHHARIVISDDTATIEDLDSKNGTYVRKKRIRRPAPLRDGDAIFLGTASLTFRRFDWAGTTATARSGEIDRRA